MQQLLTGKTRVKGAKGKRIKAKLGELFDERVERNRIDLPLLSITADRGVVSRDELSKRDTSSEDKSKYLRIAPGDIGYNTMRMWQGVSALSALEGIVSPAYTICCPTNRIDGEFAAHFFKYTHTIHLFHRYSQGLVDDTLNLKFHHFSIIEVEIPESLAEQQQIADILDAADQELNLLRTQRQTLDQQKRGLMQRLLTGKIRVKP
jgi:type I restriction enzyme S subunit